MEKPHLDILLSGLVAGLPAATELSIGLIHGTEHSFTGWRNQDGHVIHVNNADSLFEIGSVTKFFTGMLYARAVEEGFLHPDQAVQDFLPDIKPSVPLFTLEQLVLHTSGLPRMPDNWDKTEGFDPRNPLTTYQDADLLHYLNNTLKLASEPGTRYGYSNLGFGILGRILAEGRGTSFQELISSQIFRPLGMTRTGYGMPNFKEPKVKGLDEKGQEAEYWDPGALAGAMGAISTASDLVKFVAYFMESNTPHPGYQLSKHVEASPGYHSGMGIYHFTGRSRGPLLRISGGSGGFSASIAIDLEARSAAVFCSNIPPDTYQSHWEGLTLALIGYP